MWKNNQYLKGIKTTVKFIGVDEMIILKLFFKNMLEGYSLVSFGSRQGLVVDCCEYGNELAGYIKFGDVFECLLNQ